MTKKFDGDSNNELDAIGFGCNYLPFSGKDNPCTPKPDNTAWFAQQQPEVSADEHANQLFQFCGRDVFAGEPSAKGLTEEEIQEIVTSPCCCSEEELQLINEREIHLSFGGD